ncbi:glycine-rich domain-containing protein [Streptomyces sp. NPDC005263]|uniref:glycine-rich domain-containing protein n=1 Tax=Streptomyces sp. NPDC005263 TaxID=3364711 RepID=UPI00368855DD
MTTTTVTATGTSTVTTTRTDTGTTTRNSIATTTGSAAEQAWSPALTYEAPFLIEKLMKDRVVESVDEAEALFREVKRYLVMVAADRTAVWAMYSLRVDQVWHHFILFTRQYIDYCRRNFGKYIQHAPSTAPPVEGLAPRRPSTFQQFSDTYENLFGEPLPDLWYDEKSVTPDRRIVNSRLGAVSLREDEDMIELLNGKGEPIFAVDRIARSALEFITRTGTFFVRELPGDLMDDQKIALVSTLVENKILDIAT